MRKWDWEYIKGYQVSRDHFSVMPAKRKFTCDECFRTYSTKQNLQRHCLKKHSLCSLNSLEIKCTVCKEIFVSIESFKAHLSRVMDVQSGRDSVSVRSVGTPVQDEVPTDIAQDITPWTALQPMQNGSLTNGLANVTTGLISVSSGQSLYNDIQEFVEKETLSPVTDTEALPEPEPLCKKKKISCVKPTDRMSETVLDRIDKLEQRLNSRLSTIEESLLQTQTLICQAVQENSIKQQHYSRSLTAVLQKDIKLVKEGIQQLASSSDQQLPQEVIKSIVDLNGSLLSFIRKSE